MALTNEVRWSVPSDVPWMDDVDPSKDVQDKISTLRPQIDSFRTLHREIEELPGFLSVKAPANCLFTRHRRTMYRAHEAGGWPSLCHYLYAFAQGAAVLDNSYKYFVEDYDQLKRKKASLPFLLSQIHPDTIRGLITGQLPTVRRKNQEVFDTTPLRSEPGIYCNMFCNTRRGGRADTQRSSPDPRATNAKVNEGKGFSIAQLKNILQYVDKYINDDNYAYTIDSNPGPRSGAATLGTRRWYNAANRNHREKFAAWKSFIENEAMSINYPASKPLDWCISSVGYGTRTSHRALDHAESESTSHLFGMINGIIRQEFRSEYELMQCQIIYICDKNHRNLAEALVSVLASSYHDEGGLNAQRAGGTAEPKDPTAYAKACEKNMEWLLRPGGGALNVSRSVAVVRGRKHASQATQRMDEYVKMMNQKPMATLEKEVEDACQEFEESSDKMESLQEGIALLSMEQKLGALQQELLTSMEDHGEEDSDSGDEDAEAHGEGAGADGEDAEADGDGAGAATGEDADAADEDVDAGDTVLVPRSPEK